MNPVWPSEGSIGDLGTVRASIGTLVKLGLLRMKMAADPKTAYLLVPGGCLGRCAFCPQSIEEDRLARLKWPLVDIESVLRGQELFERVCIQSTLKRGFPLEVENIASLFRGPVSVSINPVHRDLLRRLRRYAERIGVGLDAMSPTVFDRVNKPGSWNSYVKFIERAIDVFGRGKVHVHLIAGMGESLEEAVHTMSTLQEMGAEVALFSFTPVSGTPMGSHPRPDIKYYRQLQVIRHFLSEGIPLDEIRMYDPDEYREAFLTSGCPSCNRPFYNEDPRGPVYNFPNMDLLDRSWEEVRREVISAIGDLRIRSQG